MTAAVISMVRARSLGLECVAWGNIIDLGHESTKYTDLRSGMKKKYIYLSLYCICELYRLKPSYLGRSRSHLGIVANSYRESDRPRGKIASDSTDFSKKAYVGIVNKCGILSNI